MTALVIALVVPWATGAVLVLLDGHRQLVGRAGVVVAQRTDEDADAEGCRG